ncbi:MAG TPA: hypothetical protein VGK53_19950 [Propionicimonas sp.]|jgi:hypothetical protein
MRLSVLYSTDGRILSVMRSAAADARDRPEATSPDIAVRPAEGERVAFLDVDAAWDRRPLAEIHQAFTVADGVNGPYLRPRESAT